MTSHRQRKKNSSCVGRYKPGLHGNNFHYIIIINYLLHFAIANDNGFKLHCVLGFIKRHTVQCPYKPTVRIASQLFCGFWLNRLRTGRHFVIST